MVERLCGEQRSKPAPEGGAAGNIAELIYLATGNISFTDALPEGLVFEVADLDAVIAKLRALKRSMVNKARRASTDDNSTAADSTRTKH